MTGRLVEILFTASGVLLAPVLLLLVILSAATLWTLGGLLGEALDRRRGRSAWREFLADLKEGEAPASIGEADLARVPARFRSRLLLASRSPAGARKGLDDLELAMARRLSWLSFATRVGPMLGLIGTLLPLGPALRGLASDDLGTLAEELEVAFAATVFGLLVGGLAYAAGVARRNWYDQDLADLEFALDAVAPAVPEEPAHA